MARIANRPHIHAASGMGWLLCSDSNERMGGKDSQAEACEQTLAVLWGCLAHKFMFPSSSSACAPFCICKDGYMSIRSTRTYSHIYVHETHIFYIYSYIYMLVHTCEKERAMIFFIYSSFLAVFRFSSYKFIHIYPYIKYTDERLYSPNM